MERAAKAASIFMAVMSLRFHSKGRWSLPLYSAGNASMSLLTNFMERERGMPFKVRPEDVSNSNGTPIGIIDGLWCAGEARLVRLRPPRNKVTATRLRQHQNLQSADINGLPSRMFRVEGQAPPAILRSDEMEQSCANEQLPIYLRAC